MAVCVCVWQDMITHVVCLVRTEEVQGRLILRSLFTLIRALCQCNTTTSPFMEQFLYLIPSLFTAPADVNHVSILKLVFIMYSHNCTSFGALLTH